MDEGAFAFRSSGEVKLSSAPPAISFSLAACVPATGCGDLTVANQELRREQLRYGRAVLEAERHASDAK